VCVCVSHCTGKSVSAYTLDEELDFVGAVSANMPLQNQLTEHVQAFTNISCLVQDIVELDWEL